MIFAFFHRMTAVLVCGALACGTAKAADTPPSLDGAKVVSAEEVVAARAAGTPIIDTRVASEYADGHIKGAVNIPYREKSAKAVDFIPSQDEFNLAKMPADKVAPVVIYCNGAECWKSYKAATAAIKGGYAKVYWYRDGFPEWKSKGLPVD